MRNFDRQSAVSMAYLGVIAVMTGTSCGDQHCPLPLVRDDRGSSYCPEKASTSMSMSTSSAGPGASSSSGGTSEASTETTKAETDGLGVSGSMGTTGMTSTGVIDGGTTEGLSTGSTGISSTETGVILDMGGLPCGDGVLDEGEECDEGDDNGEECSMTCKLRPCEETFEVDGMDVCGDGNKKSGDGCSANCEEEYVMFVTAGKYDGDIGPQTTADALCQDEATEAELRGTYVAWLWVWEPGDILAGVPDGPGDMLPSGRRLVRTDGMTIVDDADELIKFDFDGLNVPVDLDPMGISVNLDPMMKESAWTGWVGVNCEGWTSSEWTQSGRIGNTGKDDWGWTIFSNSRCDEERHLYCFRKKED